MILYCQVKREGGEPMGEERKLVNFRMLPEELESLKILAELHGLSQADTIRFLINAEMEKQEEAVKAYKKNLAEIKAKVKK